MEKHQGQKIVKMWRGRWVSVVIEPCHPRYQMCFSEPVKKVFRAEGDRFDLADTLAPYLNRALQRYPDDPLFVRACGHRFKLSEHPGKPGKMLVQYDGPAIAAQSPKLLATRVRARVSE